jgi:hypothetical protein
MTKQVEVRPSFAGFGVFAKDSFEPGEFIGWVEGCVVPKSNEFTILVDHDDKDYEPEPPFRFLNHSCDSNANVFDDGGEHSVKVYVEATKPIKPGDEITITYEYGIEDAIPCKCGSPKCRGWIVAEEKYEELMEREGAVTV